MRKFEGANIEIRDNSIAGRIKSFAARMAPIVAVCAAIFSTEGCGSSGECSKFEDRQCSILAGSVGAVYKGCRVRYVDFLERETAECMIADPDNVATIPPNAKDCEDKDLIEKCKKVGASCVQFPQLDKAGDPIEMCITKRYREKTGEPTVDRRGEIIVTHEARELTLPDELLADDAGAPEIIAVDVVGPDEPTITDDNKPDASEPDAIAEIMPEPIRELITEPTNDVVIEQVIEGKPELVSDATEFTPEPKPEINEPKPETSEPKPEPRPEVNEPKPEPRPETKPEIVVEIAPEPAPDKPPVTAPVCSAKPTGDSVIKWDQQGFIETNDKSTETCRTAAVGETCSDKSSQSGSITVFHSQIVQKICDRFKAPQFVGRMRAWIGDGKNAMFRITYNKGEGKFTWVRFFRALGKRGGVGVNPSQIPNTEKTISPAPATETFDYQAKGFPKYAKFIGIWLKKNVDCKLTPAEKSAGADSCVIGAEYKVKK